MMQSDSSDCSRSESNYSSSSWNTQRHRAAPLPEPYRDSLDPCSGPLTNEPAHQETRRTIKRACFDSIWIDWWWIVILGQSLLCLGPIFFYVVMSYKQIALPDRIAMVANKSPGWVTFSVTLISTVLSGISSTLFCKAVLSFLALRLTWPTSLFELATTIELSRGQFIFRRAYPNWSIVTLLIGLLLKTLTASFATLVTPTTIVVNTPLSGVEIDLGSEAFVTALGVSTVYRNMISSLRSNNPTSFGSMLVSSGMAAAYSQLGFTRLFEFDSAMFKTSTAGIRPVGEIFSNVGLAAKSVEQNLIGGSIQLSSPARFHLQGQKTTPTTPANHTVLQQGFTANVRCLAKSASLNATPQTIPLPLLDSTGASNYSLTKWTFNASCPNGERLDLEDVITATGEHVQSGGLMMVALCRDQMFNGTLSRGNHLLSIIGTGEGYKYLKPRVCSIRPLLTKVSMKYEDKIELLEEREKNPLSPNVQQLSVMVLRLIEAGVSGSQNIYTNTFGDGLKSLYAGADEKFEDSQAWNSIEIDDNRLNEIMESYFKGQLEFIASYMRSSFSGTDLLAMDFRGQMNRTVEGVWQTTTSGWDRASHSSALAALIPILLVGILSIAAILKSRSRNRKIFQVDDLGHLIEAAGGGNLVEGFLIAEKENKVLLKDVEDDYRTICDEKNRLQQLEKVNVKLEKEDIQDGEWCLKYCP